MSCSVVHAGFAPSQQVDEAVEKHSSVSGLFTSSILGQLSSHCQLRAATSPTAGNGNTGGFNE